MNVDLKFDIGFLTTPIAINSVLMELFDNDQVSFTTKVYNIVRDFDNNNKRSISIQNLLEHNSGKVWTI